MLPEEITFQNKIKGTRILFGPLATTKRNMINSMFEFCYKKNYVEIDLPSLEDSNIYFTKVGKELDKQMYIFENGECLRPEGTATCQLIANQYKFDKEIKLCYAARCWRKETSKRGRYCEFTQFGLEILNLKSKNYTNDLITIGIELIKLACPNLDDKDLIINSSCKRGLSYYVNDGFEIRCNKLPLAEQQILGGGQYKEGIGFAIGVDRLLCLLPEV